MCDVEDDFEVEGDETVIVTIDSNTIPGTVPGGGGQTLAIGTGSATTTIVDNEVATFTVEDAVYNEGDGTVTVAVKLSNTLSATAPSMPVTVNYIDLGSAALVSDYTTVGSQTVTFAAGATAGSTQTVSFKITQDTIAENNEFFGLKLSTTYVPVAGQHKIDVSDTATIQINDDDAMQVNGVRVSNPTWNQGFKDLADGKVLGSGLGQGYRIPTVSAAQTTPLPWTNITSLLSPSAMRSMLRPYRGLVRPLRSNCSEPCPFQRLTTLRRSATACSSRSMDQSQPTSCDCSLTIR